MPSISYDMAAILELQHRGHFVPPENLAQGTEKDTEKRKLNKKV